MVTAGRGGFRMGHSVAVPLFFCLAGGRTGPSAMHGAEGWQRAEGVSPRLRRPSPDGVSELNFPREPVCAYPEEIMLQGVSAPSKVYRKHEGPVHCLAQDDSGQLLLSGASDGSVRMWKLDRRHYAPGLRPSAGFQAEEATMLHCFSAHSGPVTGLHVINGTLYSVGMDGYLKAWRIVCSSPPACEEGVEGRGERGQKQGTSRTKNGDKDKARAADGAREGVGCCCELIRSVYTRHTARLEIAGEYEQHVGVGGQGGARREGAFGQSDLQGVLKGMRPHVPANKDGHADGVSRQGVSCFAIANDIICTGGADRCVRLWHGASFQLIDELQGHSGRVCDLAIWEGLLCSLSFMEDGPGESLILWDLAARCRVGSLAVTEGDRCCAIGGAGIIATGGTSGVVTIWDLSTGRRLFTLDAHAGPITGMALLSAQRPSRRGGDGLFLYTGSHDRTVRAWDLSRQCEDSASLCMHGVEVLCLEVVGHDDKETGDDGEGRSMVGSATRPRGLTALSGCADGTVKEWLIGDAQGTALAREQELDLYS